MGAGECPRGKLTLTLLMTGVLADDQALAATDHQTAVDTALFDGRTDFHA